MKIFFFPFLLILASCATQYNEVATDTLESNPDILHLSGRITNIEEVKKKAAFSKRFAGSFLGVLIGGQIGGGTGKEIARGTGAFLGMNLANDMYGELIDQVFIEDENGRSYECYIHNHIFKIGDKVHFTVVSDHVSAVVLAEKL